MNLFSTNGKITPAEDKTNIRMDFSVPKGTKKLIVTYSYSPKYLDSDRSAVAVTQALKKYNCAVTNASSLLPVANLVTLSFDEDGKYRGACHRQMPKQRIVISDSFSTPGIENRPIKPGIWEVVMNVHYAGCGIEYSIKIDGEAE